MTDYDLIIIGAGPAGLSAGIYAARYKLKTLIIGQIPGGLATTAHSVWNFPSYKDISGMELMQKIVEQIKNLNIEIKMENVIDVENGFNVITKKSKYSCKKLIIATGSERQKLGVDKEKELTGKGISYCATCDAGFYQDKVAGVVGGGNAALTAALLLSKFAKKVFVFYRKDKFVKAEQMWVDEVEKNNKIEVIFNSNISELIGEDKLTGVKLDDNNFIDLNGLFIEIGSSPSIKLAGKLGVKTNSKSILVDRNQKTNVNGVFAAGDVTDNPLRQIITACSQGAVAGYNAYLELEKEK